MKTSTHFKALFLLLVACTLQFCVQAQTKQTRRTGNFEAVSASGAVNVFLRQGSATSVVVEASEEIQKYLKTEVQNGTLKIYRDRDFNWRDLVGSSKENSVNIYITCPTLKAISVSGASAVKGQSAFTTNDFKIQASGASDIILSLTAKSLDVNCSGASDVRLSGQAERQKVNVSGGSEYQAYALQSRGAQITASGASEAQVNIDGELSSTASGASDIRYKGNARVVSSRASGASSVRAAR
ncbi:head GIN domain-containing protein [Hymenobacter radiodurans]|uniref:head GIN domain-containing protein n=1 Tax=Hymenobacter radiodurans TaxID=2496028 RepID=UPI001058CB85|nr:head GIN domain-containing protein [Hymenobacter radiodurans]